jgi:hypothetical protein
MKFNDNQLDRLLKGAALPSRPAEEEMPVGFQLRALASWRSGGAADEPVDILRLFRIGLACACVLLVLVAAAGFREINREQADEFALPNVVFNLALTR